MTDRDPGLDLLLHDAPDDLVERAIRRHERRRDRRVPVAVLTAAALLLGTLVGSGLTGSAAPETAPATLRDEVPVRFVLHAPEAAAVHVAGTFNGWSARDLPLQRASDGTFYAVFPMPRGRHEYLFVVDGQWVVDPAAALLHEDDFGGRNAVLEI